MSSYSFAGVRSSPESMRAHARPCAWLPFVDLDACASAAAPARPAATRHLSHPRGLITDLVVSLLCSDSRAAADLSSLNNVFLPSIETRHRNRHSQPTGKALQKSNPSFQSARRIRSTAATKWSLPRPLNNVFAWVTPYHRSSSANHVHSQASSRQDKVLTVLGDLPIAKCYRCHGS